MDTVKLMAEVMHKPAIPAEANPERANNVVTRTARPPSASKFNRSQRFVIQKLEKGTIGNHQLKIRIVTH
jgi:hypothetical protein